MQVLLDSSTACAASRALGPSHSLLCQALHLTQCARLHSLALCNPTFSTQRIAAQSGTQRLWQCASGHPRAGYVQLFEGALGPSDAVQQGMLGAATPMALHRQLSSNFSMASPVSDPGQVPRGWQPGDPQPRACCSAQLPSLPWQLADLISDAYQLLPMFLRAGLVPVAGPGRVRAGWQPGGPRPRACCSAQQPSQPWQKPSASWRSRKSRPLAAPRRQPSPAQRLAVISA